ncbi:MAG: M48 family metalloprotease [Myxococcota bacterium]
MDFFEHQEVARRSTGRLVILFALAVLGLIAMTYVVIAAFMAYMQGEDGFSTAALWNWRLLLAVGAGILLVVGGAILVRISQLSAGGHVVAEMLDGRRLEPSTTDPDERRLLNVVEEMSIASGTPVPPVYLLEHEPGINAFAAGHTIDDAVIGMTRGSLEQLSRDELQGVIAHEFSHILNGDMRLNIRLMGVLYGILVIGFIGWLVLRSAMFSGARTRRSRDGGAGVIAIVGLGVSLVVIGWIGTLFGKMIKAAVSRQREYLADASAVQFTRNPTGIGGALRKIAGFDHGSTMENAQAAEVGHMLFGEGFRGLYATHPPVAERIRRIDPSLIDETEAAAAPAGAPAGTAAAAGMAGFGGGSAAAPPSSGTSAPVQPEGDLLDQLGQPSPAHLAYARELMAGVPEPLLAAAHEPYTARALIYALLLDPDPAVREIQQAALAEAAPPEVYRATEQLAPSVEKLDRRAGLPLVDMALPALGEMTRAQFEVFRSNMHTLIGADQRVDMIEWVLLRVVVHHLERHFELAPRMRVRHRSLKRLAFPVGVVLSALAHHGHREPAGAQAAFEAGVSGLPLSGLRLLPREQATSSDLDAALQALAGLGPRPQRELLTACARSIAADHEVTPEEAEIFRAVADSLDCPVPPLLPGQRLFGSGGSG